MTLFFWQKDIGRWGDIHFLFISLHTGALIGAYCSVLRLLCVCTFFISFASSVAKRTGAMAFFYNWKNKKLLIHLSETGYSLAKSMITACTFFFLFASSFSIAKRSSAMTLFHCQKKNDRKWSPIFCQNITYWYSYCYNLPSSSLLPFLLQSGPVQWRFSTEGMMENWAYHFQFGSSKTEMNNLFLLRLKAYLLPLFCLFCCKGDRCSDAFLLWINKTEWFMKYVLLHPDLNISFLFRVP